MTEAFICDFTRTPIGRYAGALKDVRADDLNTTDPPTDEELSALRELVDR